MALSHCTRCDEQGIENFDEHVCKDKPSLQELPLDLLGRVAAKHITEAKAWEMATEREQYKMSTLRENFQRCGRAFARSGMPLTQVAQVMAGVQDQRLAEIALEAFEAERADRPFDVELPEAIR